MEDKTDPKQPPTRRPLEPLVRLPFAELPMGQQNSSGFDDNGVLREVYVNLALAKLVSFFRYIECEAKRTLMNPESPPNAIAIEQTLTAIFHCLGHRLDNVVESLTRYQETVLREIQANDLRSR